MNERKLSYIYSFKCKDDLEHFEKLPETMQADIEKYIVKVITDSFVKPADEDYVTARFLAQKGMYRAFFWAASQALEKYLKAFLLMRGIAVNEKRFRGHPIVALHQEACSVDKQLSSVKTKPNEAVKIHSAVSESVDIFSVSDFISNIEAYGHPDNRYNSFGVNFNSGYLFALDSYVFGLRQLIGVPSIQESLRKMDQSLIEAFYEYNPWFESTNIDFVEIPNENFIISTSMAVTTLDFLIGTHAPHGSRFVLQWLGKKMKLPTKVSQHLKKA
ncbi:HEPN domain-containing protein [Pseudoalteromonas sp. SR44-5]|jgi:hypothetical protein|uniref:HEPN domain-containing protein n=1 Tax=unclassified Pseudoalteromonas TaxID=194690 RepID=UPI001602E285|nr:MULTISPECIES: HEPN domain-containing protein [unclassified Pseudoalteromonas]MBB1332465.1 HEPN domain-containing protein [Pseudoalteromonas sp. SR41-6]MBB1342415.1 HEPN domain-containing protein [Pseudoalteromonas sp. SR45-6]MBB1367802.1 HEPN domain-containing protein [Pseudoalteromonas sp. SR44-5]MBB1419729.1 HEPN domain-containing protein [Pseudoalteromonas sp. SG44-1]MBB1433106.1 HEPN domain-containing protein [Pseudoalteromonas sp. SG43-6]